MPDVRADALKQVPLFQGLSSRDLKHLAKQMREDVFPPDAKIVEEGDTTGRLFVILDGTAKVVIGGKTRRRMGAGSLIGELSTIDRGPRTATIVAESEVRTASLSSASFLSLLQENWTAARTVLTTLATRVRELDKTLT